MDVMSSWFNQNKDLEVCEFKRSMKERRKMGVIYVGAVCG